MPRRATLGLTERERQIVEQVTAGRNNREIAHQLGISESTVANHLHNILDKVRLPSRADLAAWWAIGQGFDDV